MEKILTISIRPDLEVYTLVRPSLEAVFKKSGLDENKTSMLVVAVEEVFSYCAKLLIAAKNKSWVDISVGMDDINLQVAIAHDGPCGSLEKYFIKGSNQKIKRTSFEALGLYIAKEIVNELEYRRFGGGKNEFVLVMNLP
jgi:anti-sigma regulatory factor (Ser/Thr protein kinase)